MSDRQTFWGLLDSYKVEVPVIQRDYAQGRETEKATQIRKNFVSHLFRLVTNLNISDDLDFIYGSAKNGTLVLLDGQQRLTTLFLLHWYLAAGNGSLNETQHKFSRFGYKTRVSSKEFIDSLIKYGIHFELSKLEGKLSEKIKDASWFFSVWLNDPTVKSMLTMLDEIHSVFQSSLKDSTTLWKNLISDNAPPITFHFLNMEDFSLTDELYIKMNARGKPLTEFENFKAWLQSFMSKGEDDNLRTFWSALDKEWTDVFWRLRDEGTYEVDNLFLSCFKSLALFQFAKNLDASPKKLSDDNDELVSKLRTNAYIPLAVYDEKKLFSYDTITPLKNFLNFIHFLQTADDDNTKFLWKDKCELIFKNGLKNDGYLDKTRFYALFVYLSGVESAHNTSKEGLIEFSDWVDVCLRLINNTAFDISVDFVRAVKAIDHLSILLRAKHLKIKDMEPGDFKFFNEIQRDEEILKAQLIERKSSWKELFREYEEHPYFYGQIGFLVTASFDQKSQEYSQDRFTEIAKKASVLFSDELIETEDFLLQRALLSIGDYLTRSGRNFSFCRNTKTSARYRYENWRAVFNNNDRRDLLIELIDKLVAGEERVGLQKIIEGSDCKDWRQHFINHPEAIAYCKNRKVRFNYESEEDEIYLLHGERISGRHYGLRTFVLYLLIQRDVSSELVEIKKSLEKAEYHEAIGERDFPGVIIDPFLRGKLDIEFHNGGFVMRYLNENDDELTLDESLPQIQALQAIMKKIMRTEGK